MTCRHLEETTAFVSVQMISSGCVGTVGLLPGYALLSTGCVRG
jgi:hypothetical protein